MSNVVEMTGEQKAKFEARVNQNTVKEQAEQLRKYGRICRHMLLLRHAGHDIPPDLWDQLRQLSE